MRELQPYLQTKYFECAAITFTCEVTLQLFRETERVVATMTACDGTNIQIGQDMTKKEIEEKFGIKLMRYNISPHNV